MFVYLALFLNFPLFSQYFSSPGYACSIFLTFLPLEILLLFSVIYSAFVLKHFSAKCFSYIPNDGLRLYKLIIFSLRLHQHTLKKHKMSTFSIYFLLILFVPFFASLGKNVLFVCFFRSQHNSSHESFIEKLSKTISIVLLNYRMQCFCFYLFFSINIQRK